MMAQNLSKRGLTAKQKAFVLEYLVDRNGKQAAIRAGYAAGSAEVEASRLLRNPKVAQYLDALTKEQHAKLKLSAETVLEELHAILTVDPIELFTDGGAVKPISEMSPSLRRAISGIEVKEVFSDGKKVGEIKKIRLWSKTDSAKMLGQHLKLWAESSTTINFNFLGHLDEAQAAVKDSIDAEVEKP